MAEGTKLAIEWKLEARAEGGDYRAAALIL